VPCTKPRVMVQVAIHAIIANLERFLENTKGFEHAILCPDSLLVKGLKASEVGDKDSAVGLRLETLAHFLRCYAGTSLSPLVLNYIDESCDFPRRFWCRNRAVLNHHLVFSVWPASVKRVPFTLGVLHT
jgi:hypothetical protein